MAENKNLMTAVEAADYLSVSVRTLNKWRSTQSVKIPVVRIGRACRYSRSQLDDYISNNSFK
jgi:excisionase family DNA binding protein